MPFDFRLLGPLDVSDQGRPLVLGGIKQRSLLALLLLHANEVVSTERLIDELWGGSPPKTVAKSVQVYVSRLRRQLGEGRLVTRSPGYMLRVDPSELDLGRFEELVAGARSGDAETRARTLRDALSLWRGPPLADLAYEPFAQPEIARLEELRLATVESWIDAELAAGRHADLVGELESLVSRYPLRERLRGQLMLSLYRCGRQGEALATYRETRRTMVDELGIEPGRELRRLEQAILDQDPALEVAAPATNPPRGAFVGRQGELAELVAGLDDAFRGRGRLFLLMGEPGIGKSRLAEELVAHAMTRDARVLVGRCWEAGGAPAYWPWVQSLRAYVRDADPVALRSQLGAGDEAIVHIIPELRPLLPERDDASALDPEAARFQLFDAVAGFLRRASRARPIVLVVDDLHAADEPSLLLLRFVARELGDMRVLLLGACRDVAPVPGGALGEALEEVGRERVTRRLSLSGFSEREVAEYVELTAAGIASPAIVGSLHDDTEGNPLFVSEIVRLLAVEGPAPDGRLAVPQSIHDVIARRLSHLLPECRRVLVLAAMLGREFALGALAELCDVGEDELLEILDEAMAARVISDVPGGSGRLRFAHVLIRDTLYEGLTTARRLHLHRRVVDAIEARHGDDPGPLLAEMAHHAIAGRDAARGLRYARAAGERALARLAYEEAVRLYEAALTALELGRGSDERTRCELLLAVADAESRAGRIAGSRRALLEAAAIARRLGLARELARAAVEYGGRIVYARAGEDDWLLPLLEEALAALPADEVELRATLLARLAGALRDEPSRARRDAVSRDAVELARRSGNAAALAAALDGRAIAILAPDTVEEVLAIARELLDLAQQIGDRERIVHGHMHALGPLLMLGDTERAEAGLEAASRVANELRQPAHLWDVGGAQAMIALAAGRLTEAERLVEQARTLGEGVQPEMVVPVYCLQRYTLCDFRGGLDEVEPAIRELVEGYPARPVFRCVLAHVHVGLGRLAEAADTVAAMAPDSFAALPVDQEWLYGMSLLAETTARLGDSRFAPVLYELLAPWATLNVVDQCEGMRGAVGRYLGQLAAAMGRFEHAGWHFEQALEMNARAGARPWHAHTAHDYAAMLARVGDQRRALELADVALASYRELQMSVPAASASALTHALRAGT